MFDAVLDRGNTENHMIIAPFLFDLHYHFCYLFISIFFRLRSGNTDAFSKSSVKFALLTASD